MRKAGVTMRKLRHRGQVSCPESHRLERSRVDPWDLFSDHSSRFLSMRFHSRERWGIIRTDPFYTTS